MTISLPVNISEKIVLHAKNFQLFENRQLAVLIMTKFCTHLLGARKSKTEDVTSRAGNLVNVGAAVESS